jgi:phospholipid N-methyltransferase
MRHVIRHVIHACLCDIRFACKQARDEITAAIILSMEIQERMYQTHLPDQFICNMGSLVKSRNIVNVINFEINRHKGRHSANEVNFAI